MGWPSVAVSEVMEILISRGTPGSGFPQVTPGPGGRGALGQGDGGGPGGPFAEVGRFTPDGRLSAQSKRFSVRTPVALPGAAGLPPSGPSSGSANRGSQPSRLPSGGQRPYVPPKWAHRPLTPVRAMFG